MVSFRFSLISVLSVAVLLREVRPSSSVVSTGLILAIKIKPLSRSQSLSWSRSGRGTCLIGGNCCYVLELLLRQQVGIGGLRLHPGFALAWQRHPQDLAA